MTGTATYLYALAPSATLREVAELRGVAEAPVRSLARGVLGCYLSTVPLAQFDEAALRENLENLEWLERTARQHDRVVQACSRMTTVLPIRLATIFADDESLAARLDDLSDAAMDTLTQLEGREEWGVKVFADPPARVDRSPHAEGSGAAYLRLRRSEHARRAEAAAQAGRDAETIYATLADLAVRSHRHAPQDGRLTGDPRPMTLNAAYLVERDHVAGFRDAVTALGSDRPAGSVVLTGPWPAYSFATLEGL